MIFLILINSLVFGLKFAFWLECWLVVWGRNPTYYVFILWIRTILERMIEAVRLVYLLIQGDNHCFTFCLSAWREKHTSRKKFCKDIIKKKRR